MDIRSGQCDIAVPGAYAVAVVFAAIVFPPALLPATVVGVFVVGPTHPTQEADHER